MYEKRVQQLNSSYIRKSNAGVSPATLDGGSDLAFFTIVGCWRNGALLSLPPSSLLRESSTLKEGRENIQLLLPEPIAPDIFT